MINKLTTRNYEIMRFRALKQAVWKLKLENIDRRVRDWKIYGDLDGIKEVHLKVPFSFENSYEILRISFINS